MNSLTEWWISYKGMSDEVLKMINTTSTKIAKYGKENWESLVAQLRQRVPFQTLDMHRLYVDETATDLIDNLFNKHIDEETLLITSSSEHDSIDANIERLGLENECVRINTMLYYDIIPQVKVALKKKPYKKAFIYLIGTNIGTGRVTPQQYYIALRDFCYKQGVKPTLVCDDVHGIYLVPRDYSVFDYVVNTAHVLVRNYDMGMLWSKHTLDFGYQYDNLLKVYIDYLDLILERRDKLSMWRDVMKNEFNDLIIYNNCLEYTNDSVPHIFSIKVNCPPRYCYTIAEKDYLDGNEVKLDAPKYETDNCFYVRMRAAQFMAYPNYMEHSLYLARTVINRAINVVNLKGEND